MYKNNQNCQRVKMLFFEAENASGQSQEMLLRNFQNCQA